MGRPLHLEVCAFLSDKFFVGLDLMSCEDRGLRPGITSVTLQVDQNTTVTAGVYTGLDLYAVCPFATVEMATAILERVRGYQYHAYTAEGGNIDPAMELGDGVTVENVYSVISAVQDKGNGYPDLSAPGEEELEDEYPYRSETQRSLDNDVDSLRSFVTRSLGEMSMQVSSIAGQLEALTQLVQSISNKVTELDSRVSGLEGGS